MKWTAAVLVATSVLLAACSFGDSSSRLVESDLASFVGLDGREAGDRIPTGIAATSVDLSSDLFNTPEPEEVHLRGSTVVAVCFSSDLLGGDAQQVAFGVLPTRDVTPAILKNAKAGRYTRFIDGCDGVAPSERTPEQVRQQQEEQREKALDELAGEVDRQAAELRRDAK